MNFIIGFSKSLFSRLSNANISENSASIRNKVSCLIWRYLMSSMREVVEILKAELK